MSFLIKLDNMLLKFIWKNKPARITNKQKNPPENKKT